MSNINPVHLDEYIEYAQGSIVSKTLINKQTGTMTLFAFDEGQSLSEHTAPFEAVVQVIEGEVELTIAKETITATVGQLVIMPADVPHSVRANKRFKMLLTMIRG